MCVQVTFNIFLPLFYNPFLVCFFQKLKLFLHSLVTINYFFYNCFLILICYFYLITNVSFIIYSLLTRYTAGCQYFYLLHSIPFSTSSSFVFIFLSSLRNFFSFCIPWQLPLLFFFFYKFFPPNLLIQIYVNSNYFNPTTNFLNFDLDFLATTLLFPSTSRNI